MARFTGLAARGRNRRAAFGRLALLAALCAALAAAPACRRKTPAERLDEIVQDFQQRKTFEAAIKAKDLLKEHPDAPQAVDARMILASIYGSQRDFEQCYKYLQEIMDQYGTQDNRGFEALLARLDTMVVDNKTTDAIATIAAMQDDFTSAPDKLRLLRAKSADYLCYVSRHEEGRVIYRDLAATEQDPGMIVFYNERITDSLFNQKQPEAAAQVFIEQIQRLKDIEQQPAFGEFVTAMESLIGELMRQKLFDLGASVYGAYLEAHPDSQRRHALLAGVGSLLLEGGRAAEAQAKFDEAFALMRQKIDEAQGATAKGELILELSRMHSLKRDHDAAIAVIKQMLADYPATELYVNAMAALINVYAAKGDYDSAIQTAREIQSRYADQEVGRYAAQVIAQLERQQAAGQARDRATTVTAATAADTPATTSTAD